MVHGTLMDAPAPASALYADAPLLRLTWLVQLRWVALGVAVLGLLIATALHLPFVAPRPIIAAIAVGALYNTWFLFRLRRLQCAPRRAPERSAAKRCGCCRSVQRWP